MAVAAMASTLPDSIGPLSGEPNQKGFPIGMGAADGEIFSDSRGRKYVRKDGTIRRVIGCPCPECGGDGIETCNNPDHGFIDAMPGEIGRLGCPGCGNDPDRKMSGPCPGCNGTGITTTEGQSKDEI